jgi:hypothetical protein
VRVLSGGCGCHILQEDEAAALTRERAELEERLETLQAQEAAAAARAAALLKQVGTGVGRCDRLSAQDRASWLTIDRFPQAEELARAEGVVSAQRDAVARAREELASAELEIEETRLDLSEMFGTKTLACEYCHWCSHALLIRRSSCRPDSECRKRPDCGARRWHSGHEGPSSCLWCGKRGPECVECGW